MINVMAKLTCPRCGKYMFPDFKLNISYCLHCGYGKPTEEEKRLMTWPH